MLWVQDPVGTLSIELLTDYHHHKAERPLVFVEGRGTISRSIRNQDIKMGSCVYQCDVPHEWIAQPQVSPVYMYTVTGLDAMSCVCGMYFLCGSTLVKVPLPQAGTVAISPPYVLNPNKQYNDITSFQRWTDERLRWDASKNQIDELVIEGKNIWKPEFAVINGY